MERDGSVLNTSRSDNAHFKESELIIKLPFVRPKVPIKLRDAMGNMKLLNPPPEAESTISSSSCS